MILCYFQFSGDTAYIKSGQHVLLDVSTAKLYSIIIEGSLILDDDANPDLIY